MTDFQALYQDSLQLTSDLNTGGIPTLQVSFYCVVLMIIF